MPLAAQKIAVFTPVPVAVPVTITATVPVGAPPKAPVIVPVPVAVPVPSDLPYPWLLQTRVSLDAEDEELLDEVLDEELLELSELRAART
ncbi:MAG: hypothetical protein EBT56_11165 [Betaproteobacteria bacterium]|nr:hypothetical protein [Betaproteobacteria bacterium]